MDLLPLNSIHFLEWFTLFAAISGIISLYIAGSDFMPNRNMFIKFLVLSGASGAFGTVIILIVLLTSKFIGIPEGKYWVDFINISILHTVVAYSYVGIIEELVKIILGYTLFKVLSKRHNITFFQAVLFSAIAFAGVENATYLTGQSDFVDLLASTKGVTSLEYVNVIGLLNQMPIVRSVISTPAHFLFSFIFVYSFYSLDGTTLKRALYSFVYAGAAHMMFDTLLTYKNGVMTPLVVIGVMVVAGIAFGHLWDIIPVIRRNIENERV